MEGIFNYLTKPNEVSMKALQKQSNNYKMVLIVIVFALFPIVNSIFEGASSGLITFIFGVLGDLIAEAFFVMIVYFVGKMFNGKATFLDIFLSIALANIIMIITSLITNLLNLISPTSGIIGLIVSIVALVGFIWYIYVWFKGISFVEKFGMGKTIWTAIISFIALGLFYFFVVVGLTGFFVALSVAI